MARLFSPNNICPIRTPSLWSRRTDDAGTHNAWALQLAKPIFEPNMTGKEN
jgi:hypothetical protein